MYRWAKEVDGVKPFCNPSASLLHVSVAPYTEHGILCWSKKTFDSAPLFLL